LYGSCGIRVSANSVNIDEGVILLRDRYEFDTDWVRPVSSAERISAALPDYTVGRSVGTGSCGLVLSATHNRLDRPVIIRQIPLQIANDPALPRRFEEQARRLVAIEHPHMVPVYTYVEDGDLCLLVMQYLTGGSVADRSAAERLTPPAAVAIALAAAAGLEAAHRYGVLHGDLTPEKLMFAADGTVKLADIGNATAADQAAGGVAAPATDVHALAATLYRLLSGGFAPGSSGRLGDVAPGVPEPIADVVMRGLAVDPPHSFDSAESFGVALAGSAAECWGPDWLGRSGIPVLGNEAIVAAAGRTSSADATPVFDTPSVGATTRTPARSAQWAFLAAGLLGLAALVLALVGIGAPERGGDLPSGAIKVAGVDPVLAGDVPVDATRPIPIALTGVEGDRVVMGLTIMGRTIGRQETSAVPAGGRKLPTTLTVDPWVLAGRTTAEVTVANDHRTLGTYRFGMTPTQPASRTAVAAFVVVVAIMAMTLMEKTIRALCRGSEPTAGGIAVPVCAAAVGATAVGLAWIVLRREPTVPGLIGCVVLATAAGVAGWLGARQMGRGICSHP
jgi:serine/threonine-protein kinase